MNITPLTIYLWQLADKIIATSGFFSVVLGIISLILLIMYISNGADVARRDALNKKSIEGNEYLEELQEATSYRDSALKFLKMTMRGFVVSLGFFVAIPSSNTIAMMIVIPEISHSKVVQQDLPDIYNAAVKALKDQITK